MGAEYAANIYRIEGKGRVKPGYDADLVLVDLRTPLKPNGPTNPMQSKCGWTPYEGIPLVGWPTHTFLRGILMCAYGQMKGRPVGLPVQFVR